MESRRGLDMVLATVEDGKPSGLHRIGFAEGSDNAAFGFLNLQVIQAVRLISAFHHGRMPNYHCRIALFVLEEIVMLRSLYSVDMPINYYIRAFPRICGIGGSVAQGIWYLNR